MSRRGLFPPIDGLAIGGHLIEEVGDELGVCSATARPAELPQLAASSVIVVDRLVEGVGVDLAGAVAVKRIRDVFEELGQSRLVVGGYAFTRGPAFGLRPHSETIPRSRAIVAYQFSPRLSAAFGTGLADHRSIATNVEGVSPPEENRPGGAHSARHSGAFGLPSAAEGVISGSQQFGQRPSPDSDPDVGELVEQRRR